MKFVVIFCYVKKKNYDFFYTSIAFKIVCYPQVVFVGLINERDNRYGINFPQTFLIYTSNKILFSIIIDL